MKNRECMVTRFIVGGTTLLLNALRHARREPSACSTPPRVGLLLRGDGEVPFFVPVRAMASEVGWPGTLAMEKTAGHVLRYSASRPANASLLAC